MTVDDPTLQWLREVIDLALLRLETFPESQGKDQLISDAESLRKQVDGWQSDPPSDAAAEDVRTRIVSLHVVLAKAPPRARASGRARKRS